MSNRIEIEINPLKVMWKAREELLKSNYFKVWKVLTISMLIPFFFSDLLLWASFSNFSVADFLSSGITGLSFTLALIGATTRIFSKDELVDIFVYIDEDNPEEGDLFYRTIGPYIWTATIWLIVSILSLLAKLYNFNLGQKINEIIKISVSSLVLLGVLCLWSLLIYHVKDVSLDVEREVNKRSKK